MDGTIQTTAGAVFVLGIIALWRPEWVEGGVRIFREGVSKLLFKEGKELSSGSKPKSSSAERNLD